MKAIKRVHLTHMPFDHNGAHATGDICLLAYADGSVLGWFNEYEDDLFEDHPDCVEEWEEEEDYEE